MTNEAPTLPRDLFDLGWRLRQDKIGRLYAISQDWGATVPSEGVEDVIANARAMTRYIRRRKAIEERRRSTTS
jgi:hypothetical protein